MNVRANAVALGIARAFAKPGERDDEGETAD